MDVYSVVNLVDGAEQGLYIGGKSIKTGDFSKKAGYLCLEQALGSDSAVTFFIAAKGGANIKNALLEAGLSAHRVYLVAQHLGIGVSGIGAYYDEETAEFLGIDKNTAILYALSIGR
jgi:nitroreductase